MRRSCYLRTNHENKISMKLEICAGSYNSAVAALEGGADRVELCSGLDEGGITPSAALIKSVCRLDGIAKHVLIRPRGGDFLYNSAEKSIILDDIRLARDFGADGVVVGALNEDGSIDVAFLKECVAVAEGLNVTFHRAFDLCANALTALEQIADAGCNRILTSGQAATAEAGIDLLRMLVEKAAGKLSIMPGCGVSAQNAYRILHETGAREIHASARGNVESLMKFRHGGVGMGKAGADEYSIKETDRLAVRQIREQLAKLA